MPHNAIKCRLLQLYDRLVYKKTARRLREGAALRFPFYIRFADGSLPSGFLSAEIQPIQECCDLCAGAGLVRSKEAVANTAGDALFLCPLHSLIVIGAGGHIAERAYLNFLDKGSINLDLAGGHGKGIFAVALIGQFQFLTILVGHGILNFYGNLHI